MMCGKTTDFPLGAPLAEVAKFRVTDLPQFCRTPGAQEMQTIRCNAATATGASGAKARVYQAQYSYQPRVGASQDQFQRELVETRYQIECPRCGFRVQVASAAEP
jgi:hypothetical protein